MALASMSYSKPAIKVLLMLLWRLGYQHLTTEQHEAVIQFASTVLLPLARLVTGACDCDVNAPGMRAQFTRPLFRSFAK